MPDAQMKSLGEVNGVRWFWAEPGSFETPGVYYWDGKANIHVNAALADQPSTDKAEQEPVGCSDHPDAPHGFDRNGSHNAGRYVCDCESWKPTYCCKCGEAWAEHEFIGKETHCPTSTNTASKESAQVALSERENYDAWLKKNYLIETAWGDNSVSYPWLAWQEATKQARSQVERDGWKLVPIEPTEEMLPDAWRTAQVGSMDHERLKQVYRDMLAAAPSPAQAQEGE